MARAWIVDGPWIARNVKNSCLQIKDCGAYMNCPNCSYRIDNTNVVVTPWPGLPKGVKFEPTDEEAIEHLEAKCGINGTKPHPLIQDFISSLTQDVGINYTHPQNLPGVTKDGNSVFFFHKTVQTNQNGQRKRRMVTPTGLKDEPVRWHKTGETKPVMLNGVQKGCKKIMVLYKSARKGIKPQKSNWVLHQYHLGTKEEEIGEFVLSKIMYRQQQKQLEKTADESESSGVQVGPRTWKITTPEPPTPVISVAEDEIAYDDTNMIFDPFEQGLENVPGASFGSTSDKGAHVTRDSNVTKDNLVRKEIEASSSSFVKKNPFNIGSGNFPVYDLEIADLRALPDFHSFDPEDSVLSWFGWLK